MKKIFLAFAVSSVMAACNNDGETKSGAKNDSTMLAAPETNSNMTDTHAPLVDSSKSDSGHIRDTATKAGR